MEADALDQEQVGGLYDEGGAPLTSPLVEQQLLGCLLRFPAIVADVRGMVNPEDFSDPFHRRLFEGLIEAEGFATNAQAIEWIGGTDAAMPDGRTGKQFIGYLIGLTIDLQATDAEAFAAEINECAERRATGDEAFLPGEATFTSKMGLVTWADRDTFAEDSYDELIEGVLPEKEVTLIIGATQAGKSFLSRHMCYCLTRGVDFMGHRILAPVPVVWCAYEGGRGIRARDQAYAKATGYTGDMMLANLTKPIDLWSKDLNVEELITEIEGICRTEFNGKPPAVIFIDTHNQANPGASEIDSEVISKIGARYKRLRDCFGCAVVVIGHTNSLGKMRGNEQLGNNVETVITVTKKTNLINKVAIPVKDSDNREVRSVEVAKQREGATGPLFDFVLPALETNIRTKFGKLRTSCVVAAPNYGSSQPDTTAKRNPQTPQGIKINSDITFNFFKMFWDKLTEFGEPAPGELQLPRGTRAVSHAIVKKAFRDNALPENKNTLESQWRRSTGALTKLGLIGFHAPTMMFWWTGKAVVGVPGTQPSRSLFEAPPDDEAPPSYGEFPEV